jgi:5-methylcytosine-specific restriction endonuclease McrBC GTP-binding regulatory subunit McrB
MVHKRSQPDPKAIKELTELYISMEKATDEEDFQPLLNRHDEITKSLGFPKILFRSLEDMKNRRHFPALSTP